ncbi:unnamed protein product [Brassicogethes aeneus]|uniref:Uncharacterized protein n=1 Tax=Brassicogethes aeneus TaxID=1431903 RepID=A0A9P0BEZ9_BRAAE|nr:unnamed protein product [Brassicogethes aeneus]
MFSDTSSSSDAEISSEDLMSDEEIRRVEKLREEKQNWKGRRLKYECGNIGGDRIGKKKISQETITKIIDQIKQFPTYISHYSRGQTEATFLSYDLTEAKMDEMYLEDESNPKVSFTFYQKIFYTNFNLRRKPPIKDTCNKCDASSTKINNVFKEQLQALHEEHLANAKLAKISMQNDMKDASTNPLQETLCYDMEKVLSLPKLPTNIVYYKRQLGIYNESIHAGSTNKPYAFIWKEGVAGRGAQEVGSCLKKFIDLHLKEGVQYLILWSIIKRSKKHNPIEVIDMKSEDFFSIQDIEKHISNRKISVDKTTVSWLKTKIIEIQKDKPFSIFLKESQASESRYQEVDISKVSRGRKIVKDFSPLTPLYPDGKEISNKKAEDINLKDVRKKCQKPDYKLLRSTNIVPYIIRWLSYNDFEIALFTTNLLLELTNYAIHEVSEESIKEVLEHSLIEFLVNILKNMDEDLLRESDIFMNILFIIKCCTGKHELDVLEEARDKDNLYTDEPPPSS